MSARVPRSLAVVVLFALVAPVAVAGPGSGVTTAAPAAAGPPMDARRAIPAPLCSVPSSAGVLALVPPAGGMGTSASATGPADPAVGANRTAVVDRFEGDTAVLLVEARGEVVARRLVRRSALPRAARHQDAVVSVSVVNDSVAAITYRPVETARRERRAERRFGRLSEPAPGGDGPALC